MAKDFGFKPERPRQSGNAKTGITTVQLMHDSKGNSFELYSFRAPKSSQSYFSMKLTLSSPTTKKEDEGIRTLDEVFSEKGGAGSGDTEGHPFRGNQWSEGSSEGGGKGKTSSVREERARKVGAGAAEAIGAKLGKTYSIEEGGAYGFNLSGAPSTSKIGDMLIKAGWRKEDDYNFSKGSHTVFISRNKKFLIARGEGENAEEIPAVIFVRDDTRSLDEVFAEKGGPGSGFFGHAGRPGQVGGAAAAGGEGGGEERRAGGGGKGGGVAVAMRGGGPGRGAGGEKPLKGKKLLEKYPQAQPLKKFKNEEVFSKYVPKKHWSQNIENQKWLMFNRKVGSLEAMIGHARVRLFNATSTKQYEGIAKYITEMADALAKMIGKRDKVSKEETTVEKAAEGLTEEEVKELEAEDIKDIEDEVIAKVAEDMGISEEEMRKLLGDIVGKEEGGDTMGMIIQSIILPKGTTMDMVVSRKGLEFLAEADTEQAKEFDRYVRYDQFPVEKFEKDSLSLVKIHDSGVWVLGGKMVDKDDADNALTLGSVAKQVGLAPSVMDRPVGQVDVPAVEVSFGNVFQQELSAFLDILYGIFRQGGRDPASRKADALNALDAFGAFLSMALDAVGEKSVKMEEVEIVLKNAASDITEKDDETEGGDEMFKTKEEFVAGVTEVLTDVLPEMITKAVAKAVAEKQPPQETDEEKKKRLEEEKKKEASAAGNPIEVQMSALTKQVEEIGKSVKTLSEKTDKLGSQLMTDPAAAGAGAEGGGEGGGKKTETGKESVFKGIFSKRTLTPQQRA